MSKNDNLNRIIFALGSNYNASVSMLMAKKILRDRLDSRVRFTTSLITQPIGIISDSFINCLGMAHTQLSEYEVNVLFKQVENECGNKNTLRANNKIVMDIDMLMFNDKKLHIGDWKRSYILTLMRQFKLDEPCDECNNYKFIK